MKITNMPPITLPSLCKPLYSTKTFGHDIGLSCTFRQWRADSHCRFLHGYALSFKFTFAAHVPDERGWVVDFGGLKGLRAVLERYFDHKTLVAADDPKILDFGDLHEKEISDVVIVPGVGCEAFARIAFDLGQAWLEHTSHTPRCWLVSVEVSEHGANSAVCHG